MKKLVLATDSNFTRDLVDTLDKASKTQQDFIITPLFHPRNRREGIIYSSSSSSSSSSICVTPGDGSTMNSNLKLLTRSDMVLPSKDWVSNVVGKLSEWIDCDNVNENIQLQSYDVLIQEITWAAHLGLQAVLAPMPYGVSMSSSRSHSSSSSSAAVVALASTSPAVFPNYTRCLLAAAEVLTSYQQLWIRIPLEYPDGRDGWSVWNNIRTLSGNCDRLCIALEITESICHMDKDLIRRWYAEPLKCIIIPASLFVYNDHKEPVLRIIHQAVIVSLFPSCSTICIKGEASVDDTIARMVYLRHLCSAINNKNLPGKETHNTSLECQYTNAYGDHLQMPLQPLKDNLVSGTYEVFEADPVKYNQYEKAMALAMTAWRDEIMTTTGEGNKISNEKKEKYVFRLAIVGAGRGPLVVRAIRAVERIFVSFLSGSESDNDMMIRVDIVAVEKNPNAIITLRNRFHGLDDYSTKIPHNVTISIIKSDMRTWGSQCENQASFHLLISELLGSWGDNELSPECLEPILCVLREDGVSIPADYTSYISPVATSKLWAKARVMAPPTVSCQYPGLETPYVVKLSDYMQLVDDQKVFKFFHFTPQREKGKVGSFSQNQGENQSKNHLRRFASVSSIVSIPAIVHGFKGTFESTLFDDVIISTRTSTHSPGMYSWFPLYIPLERPITVKPGDRIEFCVWRCTD
jgi:type II protein arginine methyltransferase